MPNPPPRLTTISTLTTTASAALSRRPCAPARGRSRSPACDSSLSCRTGRSSVSPFSAPASPSRPSCRPSCRTWPSSRLLSVGTPDECTDARPAVAAPIRSQPVMLLHRVLGDRLALALVAVVAGEAELVAREVRQRLVDRVRVEDDRVAQRVVPAVPRDALAGGHPFVRDAGG